MTMPEILEPDWGNGVAAVSTSLANCTQASFVPLVSIWFHLNLLISSLSVITTGDCIIFLSNVWRPELCCLQTKQEQNQYAFASCARRNGNSSSRWNTNHQSIQYATTFRWHWRPFYLYMEVSPTVNCKDSAVRRWVSILRQGLLTGDHQCGFELRH